VSTQPRVRLELAAVDLLHGSPSLVRTHYLPRGPLGQSGTTPFPCATPEEF
jgi:hypothetical protein